MDAGTTLGKSAITTGLSLVRNSRILTFNFNRLYCTGAVRTGFDQLDKV